MFANSVMPVITVADIGASLAFYRDSLGFAVKVETPEWVELQGGSGGLALHAGGERVESATRAAGRVNFSLRVDDLEATCESLRERGVEFIMGPTPQEFGVTMAVFQDPDGVSWHLVAPGAEGKSRKS
jgi:catechol 2,3-dioxygenase-like lactoylglutathione lyase family enzyme